MKELVFGVDLGGTNIKPVPIKSFTTHHACRHRPAQQRCQRKGTRLATFKQRGMIEADAGEGEAFALSLIEDVTFNLSTFEPLPDDIEPWRPDYPHVPKRRFFWTHLSNGSITWYEINCWVLFGNGLSGYICDHRTNLDPQWNLLYVAWWGAVNY